MEAKDIATVTPGGAAIAASWFDLIETTLSITLPAISIAFIIYR